MRRILPILLLAVSLFACKGHQTTATQAEGDTVRFKYARLISVVRHQGYTEAALLNPWKEGKTLHRYVLVPSGQELPADLPEGTLLRTPLRRSMMFTTVHCALLMDLGREDCIAGVADLKYIKLPWIQEQVRQGRITDVGEGMSPVIEKIIDRQPDAIFLSPFENSGGYGRLEEINIPLVECAEYMEASPLARAEWMRFYGMLFGCEQRADSLFHAVDSSYNALRQLASLSPTRRSVMVDKQTGSVWYVPGGQSTIGQMVKDANGQYPYADDRHSGSVSLPFEAVLEKCGECEVWLFRYSAPHDITMQELLSEHHGYGQFRAVSDGEVYACDVGRSQFYEESPFHPDYLLNDFIGILHPDIRNLPPARYYKKVKR